MTGPVGAPVGPAGRFTADSSTAATLAWAYMWFLVKRGQILITAVVFTIALALLTRSVWPGVVAGAV